MLCCDALLAEHVLDPSRRPDVTIHSALSLTRVRVSVKPSDSTEAGAFVCQSACSDEDDYDGDVRVVSTGSYFDPLYSSLLQ